MRLNWKEQWLKEKQQLRVTIVQSESTYEKQDKFSCYGQYADPDVWRIVFPRRFSSSGVSIRRYLYQVL